ncbi:hypothetical protein D9758_013607 [Tetrapyrgos nigripes]|uniref:SCP domain-containing protein n=1 Tax=Tetrapyrgos nigripes TaxID=182062 RepID=A0A8H5FHY6_9AGAR|nr:hypothetical protein D9758_013607 [Tetrapyrgos nigripes]
MALFRFPIILCIFRIYSIYPSPHPYPTMMFFLKFTCTVILSLTLALSAHSAAISVGANATVSVGSSATVSVGASTTSSVGTSTTGATPAQISLYLRAHNSLRTIYNATSMIWNDTLASYAQNYVNLCVYAHSNPDPYGENIAAGYGSSYSIARGLQDWANENSTYNYNAPKASHFTQMVWKGSVQLGCASQTCTLVALGNHVSTYIVCEYYPKGNVDGKFPANVNRPVSN